MFGFLSGFRGFIMSFYYSLNPLSYKQLSTKPIIDAFRYLLLLLFFSFLVMSILFVPLLYNLSSHFSETLSKFSELKLNPSIATTEPVMLIPGILVDTTGNATEPNPVLITGERAEWLSLRCFVFKPLCLLQSKEERIKSVELQKANDLIANKEVFSKLMQFFVLFLAPTLLLFFYILFLVKYVFIILLFSFFTFVITRMLLFEINAKAILNTAIYSSTIMIISEVLNLRFNLELFYIPLIAYVIFFITGIYLVGRRQNKRTRGQ